MLLQEIRIFYYQITNFGLKLNRQMSLLIKGFFYSLLFIAKIELERQFTDYLTLNLKRNLKKGDPISDIPSILMPPQVLSTPIYLVRCN